VVITIALSMCILRMEATPSFGQKIGAAVLLEAGMDIISYITPQIVVLAIAVPVLFLITLVLVALAVRKDS
jgi:hypothetical protein